MWMLEENFVVDTVAWPTWRATFRFVGQITGTLVYTNCGTVQPRTGLGSCVLQLVSADT